ncbi:MAG: minor capsid protein [Clostridium neonatale]
MNNQEYWKKRAEEIADLEYSKVEEYRTKMQLEYKDALKSIQKDIEIFYARFAQNNDISLLEAKKLLNSDELEEFKMDLAEFRKMSKQANPDWEKELVNVSLKTRISRLEALQARIRNAVEQLYNNQQEEGTDLLKDTYEDTYYRNIYNIQSGTGVGIDFAKPDSAALDKVINEKWLGSNYSDRLWKDKIALLTELQTNLAQAFIRGDSIDKTTKTVAGRLGTDFNKTRTLINTESAYIAQKATFDGYKATGVEQYQILATLDSHTSKLCRSLDLKIFNLSDKEIGVTAPPFHPNCRTTTVAYFDEMMFGERLARDSEGKTYYVDRNMSYEEWYNKYVKGNHKEEVAELKIKNKSSDKKQYEEYKEILGDETPKTFDKFQELKYNNSNEWSIMKDYYKARTEGNISSFSSFSDYKKTRKELNDKLIGVKTSDGVEIKSFSKHMIDRILGTSNDPKTGLPRSGTTIDGVLDALKNPLQITETKARKLDKVAEISKKYIGEISTVSINPTTGNLIQSNPTDKDKVRRLKGV